MNTSGWPITLKTMLLLLSHYTLTLTMSSRLQQKLQLNIRIFLRSAGIEYKRNTLESHTSFC